MGTTGFLQGFLQTSVALKEQQQRDAALQAQVEQQKAVLKLHQEQLKGQQASHELERTKLVATLRKQEELATITGQLTTLLGGGGQAESPEAQQAIQGKVMEYLLRGGNKEAVDQILQQQQLRQLSQLGQQAPIVETPAPVTTGGVPSGRITLPGSRGPQYTPSGEETKIIQQAIVEEAKRQGVDPALALSVAHVESNFRNIPGDGGKAAGYFQLHEGAAKDVGLTAEQRLDPKFNIQGGVGYLKLKLAQAGGDPIKAATLYNGGGDPSYAAKIQQALPLYSQGGATAGPGGAPAPALSTPAPPPDARHQLLSAQKGQLLAKQSQYAQALGNPQYAAIQPLLKQQMGALDQQLDTLDKQLKLTPRGRYDEAQAKAQQAVLEQEATRAGKLQATLDEQAATLPGKKELAEAGKAITPIPRETIAALTNNKLAYSQIKKIEDLLVTRGKLPANFLELVAQGSPEIQDALRNPQSDLTGVFNQFSTKLEAAAQNDPQANRFLSALATLRDLIIRERSGASVTGNEIERATGAFFGSLPNANQAFALFAENLANAKELVTETLVGLVDTVRPLAGGENQYLRLAPELRAIIDAQGQPVARPAGPPQAQTAAAPPAQAPAGQLARPKVSPFLEEFVR